MIYLLLLRCLSHRPSHHRALLPITLPIVPLCAAAHHIAHHAVVGCCPSCHPLCRCGLLPIALPVVLPCAAARRTAVVCCPSRCPSHHRGLLPVAPPIMLPCAAARRVARHTTVHCCPWCCLLRRCGVAVTASSDTVFECKIASCTSLR